MDCFASLRATSQKSTRFFDTIELSNARSRGSVYQRTLSQPFLSKKESPVLLSKNEAFLWLITLKEQTLN